MSTESNLARARQLLLEHQRGATFTPFVGDSAIADIEQAYAVQHALVDLMVVESGDRVAGYKIGLTSPRMQALLNIDSPIAGQVLSARLFGNGHTVRRSDYVQLGLECEIAVKLKQDLEPTAAPFELDTVTAAVGAVCPAFELVDDRAADYSVTDIGSLVADNSWNAGIVLGDWVSDWPDLAKIEGVALRNGEELDRGRGVDVLGHPFVPLCWLANHLAGHGRGLRAGDIIATGSMVPTRVPVGPEDCAFVVDDLGTVALTVLD